MATRERASMSDIVGRYEEQLLPEWIQHQLASTTLRRDLLSEEELQHAVAPLSRRPPQGPGERRRRAGHQRARRGRRRASC